jgi:Ca2+-binding RTX toxin-like protein
MFFGVLPVELVLGIIKIPRGEELAMFARALTRSLACVLAMVVAVVVPATPANAATVTVRNTAYGEPGAYYVAARGERNDVLVANAGDSRLRITDPGAVITATGRCRSVNSHSAVCRASQIYNAHVELGDLDDRARTAKPTDDVALTANGGPGNDVLRGAGAGVLNGGDGDDRIYGGSDKVNRFYVFCCSTLNGGRGQDQIYAGAASEDDLNGGAGDDRLYGDDDSDGSNLDGGGGRDQLYGGAGDDWLTDGDRDGAAGDAAPGPDTLDGGGGWDTLSYVRTRAVTVRTRTDTDAGEVGEHDSAIGIENLYGGTGDDRLIGDDQDNVLDGFDGADVLIGRGGYDNLRGGRGRDRLRAGPGSDRLFGGAGIDSLSCGGGTDLIEAEQLRVREVVSRHCERLVFESGSRATAFVLSPHLRRTQPWWLSLRTECPTPDEGYYGCRGTVTVRESGGRHRLLGLGSFSHDAADGASFFAPIALTTLGWRWQAGGLRARLITVSLRVIAEATPRRAFRWTIRSRRRE